tara:strand:- start:1494 stop:3605 length:2112 start_codon:yes stop_codon:yes gene_type:complete
VQRARGVSQQNNIGRAVAGVGNQLAQVGFGLLKAADDDAAHQARVNAQLKLQQLELDLQTEDPIGSMSTFAERAEAIIAEAGNGLSMNAQRSFDSAAREMVARSQIAVQKDGIIRGRQKLEANLVSGISGTVNAIRYDDTDLDRQTREDNVREMIAESVNNRVIAADEGARLFNSYLNDADSARAKFDLAKNPNALEQDVQSTDKYKNLTGEQRAGFAKSARVEIEKREREIKTEQRAEDRETTSNVQAAVRVISSGAKLPEGAEPFLNPEFIKNKIHDKELGALLAKQIADAKVFGNHVATLQTMSNAEVTELAKQYVDEGQNISDLDLASQDMAQATAIQRAAQKIIKERLDDPATAAMKSSDVVRKAYDDFRSDPTNVDAYQRLSGLRNAEYDRLGIAESDRQLLPKQYAKGLAADLSKKMRTNPQSVVNEINNLRNVMGDDFDGLLGELTGAKLDDRVASIMMVDDPDVQDRLITLMGQATTQELKQSVDTGDLSKVLTAKMNDVTSAAGDRGVALANTSRNAVELIALGYMRSGLSVDKAVDKAFKDVVTDNYLVVSLPRLRGIVAKSDRADRSEFDASRVQNALGTWAERNPDLKFNRKQFNNLIGEGDTEEVAQEKMRSLLTSGSAIWIMSQDGTEANLTDATGRVVQDANGKPISATLDDQVKLHNEYMKKKSRELRTKRRIRTVDTAGKIAGRP